MKQAKIALITTLVLLLAACSINPRIIPPSSDLPDYESLGTLEVFSSSDVNAFQWLITFGLTSHFSEAQLKNKLKKELVHKARNKFHADAVIDITYWPKREAELPLDRFYARGEMIRYKPFSAEASQPA